MSVFASKAIGFNAKEFKSNAKMLESNELDVELFGDVIANQIEKNKIKYLYPASIAGAEVHQNANKYGYHPKPKGEPPVVCACCQEHLKTEDLPLCYSTTSMSEEQKLGYQQFKLELGVSLFFQFIKFFIFYLIFRILVNDSFNIASNILNKYCSIQSSMNPCHKSMMNTLSLVNKTDNQTHLFIQQILDLVVIILSIILFFCIRKKQYNFMKLLKEKKQTEDSYTIMVSEIPLIDFPTKKQMQMKGRNKNTIELWHRKHLWKFFQNKINKWLSKEEKWKLSKGTTQYDFHRLKEKNNGELRSSQIVTSISLCYNLGRLEIIQDKRNDLIKNQTKYQKIRDKMEQELGDGHNEQQFGVEPLQDDLDSRFSTIPKQVEFLNDCEIILNKQYANDNSVLFNMTNLVGYAFISFQYQHYKEYILEQASKDSQFLSYNGSNLRVQGAKQPQDINWQNFRHSVSKKKKRKLTTISFVILAVFITFITLLVVDYFRFSRTKFTYQPQQPFSQNILPYGFMLWIIFFLIFSNQIIKKIVKHCVQRQKHKSKTQQKLSYLRVTVFGQFSNTALTLFILNRIFGVYFGNYVGLINIVIGYTIVEFVSSLIIELVYPSSIWKSLKFCCKYRNMVPEDCVHMFQRDLNYEYEHASFSLIEKYSKYLYLLLFVSFYANLTPIICPVFLVYMFLIYWVDKINLFKRSRLSYRTNFAIARSAVKIMESSIFFFSLGSNLFYFFIFNQISYFLIISLAISFLFALFLLFVPYGLEKKVFGNYQSSEGEIYDDCVAQGKFESTYWSTNPATFLVKESQITNRKSVFNPVVKKIYANQFPQKH